MKHWLGLFVLLPAMAFAQDKPAAPPAETKLTSIGIHQCMMRYPVQAQQFGASGSTTLLMRVTAEGRVIGVIIAASSGLIDLDAASVECAKAWRFVPMKFDRPTEIAWSTGIRWIYKRGPLKRNLVLREPYNTCLSDPELGPLKPGFHPGTTVLSYELRDGRVMGTLLVKSSGDAALDRRALACVKSWQFEPETDAGYVTVTGSGIGHPGQPVTDDTVPASGMETAVFDWSEFLPNRL